MTNLVCTCMQCYRFNNKNLSKFSPEEEETLIVTSAFCLAPVLAKLIGFICSLPLISLSIVIYLEQINILANIFVIQFKVILRGAAK